MYDTKIKREDVRSVHCGSEVQNSGMSDGYQQEVTMNNEKQVYTAMSRGEPCRNKATANFESSCMSEAVE